jgi:dTDP-4-dehydrorhamnose reductase
MKPILLLGKIGQLGWEARRVLACLGDVTALDYPEVDFSRPEQLRDLVREIQPRVIYNAAAYTAVDRAESEIDLARAINATAAGVLAECAAETGAALVHFSTDYVFDGEKGAPYLETDTPRPLNMYGQTKLEGEQAIQQVDCAYLILRTAWVYSWRRDSFLTKVLQWARERPTLRVVADQVSNPTWSRSLAEITGQLLARAGDDIPGWVRERRGVYHLAGNGSASRLEWAQAILANRPPGAPPVEVLPAQTSEFPTPARRPLRNVLDCDLFARTFGLRLPPWEQALQLAMESPLDEGKRGS